jgi:predicted anti-sigma-YlaC factor YlaD
MRAVIDIFSRIDAVPDELWWNWRALPLDYGGMRADPRCNDVRLSLSARLDGEPMPMAGPAVDSHVDDCAMCRAWLDGAERMTRAVRVQPVEVPDLTARILARLQADGTVRELRPAPAKEPAGAKVKDRLRWGLGGLAIVQLMLAMPALLGNAGHDAHSGREVAALEIALSVGLLVTAFYPEYARVFAPVAVTLVICFAAISALDTIEGAVTPARIALHLLTVAQAICVWLIARRATRPLATA